MWNALFEVQTFFVLLGFFQMLRMYLMQKSLERNETKLSTQGPQVRLDPWAAAVGTELLLMGQLSYQLSGNTH